MSVSGIYVLIDPPHWDAATEALGRLPGVELHQNDPSTGRLVLTQDADSEASRAAGLEQISRIPGLRLARPVYHYVEDDDAANVDRTAQPRGV